uniref:Transposase n=1 Tax=Elaeophora elaphi TaxID=1147741 RepID=A0A0R3RIY8_9BILA
MLGTARGVSLGLGKINLAALDPSLHHRDGYLKARRKQEKTRRKVIKKKHVHIEVNLLRYFLSICAQLLSTKSYCNR